MYSSISIVPPYFSSSLKGRCAHVFFIYFMFLIFSVPAHAYDLVDIYKLALKNDATFQKEIFRHEASLEIYDQALSEMLPVLGLEAYYQRSKHEIFDNEVEIYGDSIARYPSKGFDLVLRQPIFKYSSVIGLSQAEEEVKRADLEFVAAGQDLILRVTEAYLKVLESRDILRFSKSEEEAVSQHYRLAKERYDNGLVPITDYHDAKARLAAIITKRIRAEHSLEDALEGLAELTGIRIDFLKGIKSPEIETDAYYYLPAEKVDAGISEAEKSQVASPPQGNLFNSLVPRKEEKYDGDIIPLITPLPDDMEEWVLAAKKQNLDILVKEKELYVVRQEIDKQRSEHLPTLSLVGRWKQDEQGGSLYGGGSDIEKWEGLVELKVPLFNGFSTSSKVREARLLAKAVREELEKENRTVIRKSKVAFLGIKSSIENIKALKQAMISNQIALDAKKEGFKSGLFSSLAVTDAERDLYQIKQEYAKSQYEYIIYSLRLKEAVGLLKMDDIVVVNDWLD
ncbi:MAG: TolC family protein [Deltaproteobacteria bacterium]|nr:TolC family protein [Deltaproteobacteria bacterium]